MTMTPAQTAAHIAGLEDRVSDLVVDINRLVAPLGYNADQIAEAVAAIRALKAKNGDTSVNAMIAIALTNNPNLKAARDAIDKQLLIEAAKTGAGKDHPDAWKHDGGDVRNRLSLAYLMGAGNPNESTPAPAPVATRSRKTSYIRQLLGWRNP